MMGKMMKKKLMIMFSLVLGVLLVSSMAFASESRKASLVNSPLVLDMTDIVDFPGLLGMYGNAGFLTANVVVPNGNGGLLIGDNIVFGAWVNRDREFDDVAAIDANITLAGPLPNTYNLADVFFGMSNGFGIRASIASGVEAVDAADGGDFDSTGSQALSVDVQPGFTMQKPGYRGDFGLGLTFNFFKVALVGKDVNKSIPIPSVLLRHRSTLGDLSKTINWVIDAKVTRRSYAAKHVNDDKVVLGRWLGYVVGGPKFNLPNNFAVTAGVKAQVESIGGSQTIDNDKYKLPKVTTIAAPGAVMTGEVLIRNLLTLRAGLDYISYWTVGKIYDGDPDTNDVDGKVRTMGQQFTWSAGLGLSLNRFQIDGMISQALLLSGPNFVGGAAPGFLGMLSATYAW